MAAEEWLRAHEACSPAREELAVKLSAEEREKEEREGLTLLCEACLLDRQEELAAEEGARAHETRSLAQEEKLAVKERSRRWGD